MDQITIVSSSEEETKALGRRLGCLLKPGDCVLLRGDLGTGKSVLARSIASSLGVNEPMPSPTFVIMIPYEGRIPVRHFDLYRLSDPEEFYTAGLQEYMGEDGVSLIEWPEMAELSLPDAIGVDLERSSSGAGRIIRVSARPGLIRALREDRAEE